MDTLKSLEVLSAVATTKSFAAAAEQIGISAPMATKHIQSIESRVGARLLNRTSRNVSLTEAGENYLARVKPLLEGLEEAEATLKESTVVPRGTLKLSFPVWMSNPSFAKIITRYQQQYPDVNLNIDISGKQVNLIEDGYDLTLRAGNMKVEGLIARKLGTIEFSLVASPKFLQQYGEVNNIEALNGIPFVAYSQVLTGSRLKWRDEHSSWEFQVNPIIQSEDETFLLLLAIEGAGATILPNCLTEQFIREKKLVRVLPDIINPKVQLSALYPDRNYLPAKTRSFIDYLLESGVINN
jgi:DNA-binding transcriptional LysR family regulator